MRIDTCFILDNIAILELPLFELLPIEIFELNIKAMTSHTLLKLATFKMKLSCVL